MNEEQFKILMVVSAVCGVGLGWLALAVWETIKSTNWWIVYQMRRSLKELYDEDHPGARGVPDRSADD